MNNKLIKALFFVIVCLVSMVFSQFVIIYKTEFVGLFGMDHNVPFFTLVFLVGISFTWFNHLILKIPIFKNFIYSFIGVLLTYLLAKIIFGITIVLFVRLDNEKTPLGWEFQHMWSVIPIMTGLLMILSEFYGERLKKSV